MDGLACHSAPATDDPAIGDGLARHSASAVDDGLERHAAQATDSVSDRKLMGGLARRHSALAFGT
eukprot:7829565-Alexandrium_andersonii.AAC.1